MRKLSLILLASVGFAAMTTPAWAQSAGAAADKVDDGSDIVVTGSRLRSSFEQPTPVTAISSAQLQTVQPSGIAQGLNQLPQFGGSSGPRQGGTNRVTGTPAGNFLNLRNVGTLRTLILMDGVRVPPSSAQGEVSVDVIPELLVKRVDVVTGGVAAVYGSDAVAGVVNFVLDNDFTGVRGVAQRGVSTYGDGGTYRLGVAGGYAFAGGRGHILLSIDRNSQDGVARQDRPIYDQQWGRVVRRPFIGAGAIPAGSAANPYYFAPMSRINSTTLGDKIFGGPSLLATYAGGPAGGATWIDQNGNLALFDNGVAGAANVQIGGSAAFQDGTSSLIPDVRTDHFYGRASYEILPDITVFAEFNGSQQKAHVIAGAFGPQYPIFASNPFIPANIRAAVTAQPTVASGNTASVALQSCSAGKTVADPRDAVLCMIGNLRQYRQPYGDADTDSYSARLGVNGDLGDWSFNVNYIHGYVKTKVDAYDLNMQHFYAAVDAVDAGQFAGGAANGNIVCRVTLSNPGLYPGCVPHNAFNNGQESQAVQDYLFGHSRYSVLNETDNVSANVSGSPFSTWAGPVSVSVGAEYRKARLEQTSNADPAVPFERTGLRGIGATRFGITNQGTANGKLNVKEINAEVLVPLARDMMLLHELSVTGAVRLTDYSTSGSVTTWKAGATWAPIDDLRFRVTRSRDIRAPNLFELFAGRTTTPQGLTDPHCTDMRCGSGQTVQVQSGGNPNLKPEIANTLTAGVVFQPKFLRNFSLSVDYYDIDISDAITTLTPAQVLLDCEASNGSSSSCASITRPLAFSDRTINNFVQSVFTGSINAATLRTRGVDVEAVYLKSLGEDETLSLRLLANYAFKYDLQSFAGQPVLKLAGATDTGGALVPFPKLKATLSASYENGPFGLFVQERVLGKMKFGPTSFYEERGLPAVWYTDATVTMKIPGHGGNIEFFGTVNNIFNKQPPVFTDQLPGTRYPTIQGLYDIMGRYYTAGIRFRF